VGGSVGSLGHGASAAAKKHDIGAAAPGRWGHGAFQAEAASLSFELNAVGSSGHLPLRERLLTIQRMSAPEKRKRLVERVIVAWDAVSEDSIKKAWLKAGL
ncbi:hypothetical protein PC110_g3076, partial [Phytophthora cactorum]